MPTNSPRHERLDFGRIRNRLRTKRNRRAVLRRRALAFEPLDPRLVLSVSPAGELEDITDSHLSPPRAASAGTVAQDLVAFAKALAASGTRFYGASWCPNCKDQKELFEDGGDFLPFIEVTNLDNPVTLNDVGNGTNLELNPTGVPIGSFPTWEFPDNSRLTGTQSLATLSARSGVAIPTSSDPFIAPITLSDSDIDKDQIRDDADEDIDNDGILNSNDTDIDGDGIPNGSDELDEPRSYDADGDEIVTVLTGSPLHVAFDGYDPSGDPLTYTISSSNPGLISATLLEGNRSMTIDVSGWGKMTLQMFEQRAPRPTSRLIELAESNFFDDIIFHRIINGFVIQGGDPTETGGGGSTLGDIDDQFHEELQHNRNGTLSYAKTADDTNDSQFFITEGPTRHLDGNHSVAGVIIEGDKNREAISNNSTINPRSVVIDNTAVFTDAENAVAMLTATPGASGSALITVTATDSDGNQFTRTFTANVGIDTSDTPPWLDEFGAIAVPEGTTTNIQIQAIDIEGDPIRFGIVTPTNFTVTVPSDPITPQSPAVADVSITPNSGFVGSEEVTFFVLDAGIDIDGVVFTLPLLNNNSGLVDVQTITLTSIANAPPNVSLTGATTTLPEDTDTTSRIKVGDIVIADDGVGSNHLTLEGTDKALFDIIGFELFLSEGTVLDSDTKPLLNVTVQVNDSTVGPSPDDTVALSITVTEVQTEAEISGRLFMDPDGDGTDNEDAGPLVGFLVYADLNSNGTRDAGEPISTTDIDGVYRLPISPNIPVEIRPIRPADWEVTSPAGGIHAITAPNTSPIGGKDFGLRFIVASWFNSFQPTNINGVGGTTPFDALLIINELDNPTVSDPETGVLDPLSGAPSPLSLYDVDQSGFVSGFDALLVINELPTSQPSSSSSATFTSSSPAAALSSVLVSQINPEIAMTVHQESRQQPTASVASVRPAQFPGVQSDLAPSDMPAFQLPDRGLLGSTSAMDASDDGGQVTELAAELVDQALLAEF